MRSRSQSVVAPSLFLVLPVAVLCASSSCAPSTPPSVDAVNAATCAGGEPYLAIVNRTNAGFDIYAYATKGRTYVGTAGSTDTRFSLVGTPLEHSSGMFVAVPAGSSDNGIPANDPRSPITLTWKCDRSAK